MDKDNNKETPIQELVIPQYIMKAKLSKSARKTYFYKFNKDGTISKRPIPKKYRTDEYGWLDNCLVHKATREKVVANPRTAGKPKFFPISGNKILYSTSEWVRNTVIEQTVQFFSDIISREMRPFKLDEFPLRIEWDFYTVVDTPNFDMSNFWFYYKYMEDALRHTIDPLENIPIIPDDNIRYITWPASPKLIPVKTIEDRMFIFRFYKDNRSEISNHHLWKNTRESFYLDEDILKDLNI